MWEMRVPNSLFLSFLFMVFLAPGIEEFIFRKLIIDRLGVYGEGASYSGFRACLCVIPRELLSVFLRVRPWRDVRISLPEDGEAPLSGILHMFLNLTGGIVGPSLLRLIDLDG